MWIFYIDPGLRTDVGHHANYCRCIVGELRAGGIKTPAFAHCEIQPALQAEFAVVPHFRVDTHAESDGDPICGWLSRFDAFTRTLEDFDRYAGLAYAAALRWPEMHWPARIVDALLAVVAD